MEDINYMVPNIMIVDDIPANLKVLSHIIESIGYHARPVTSVKQAMKAINELMPDMILLDISMPEIDGFEFCSMLKKNPTTRDIPVIFISAFSSTEDRIKGLRLGAVDYIVKPFDIEEAALRINTHLKIYKIQRELEIYNKKLLKVIHGYIDKIYEEQKNILYALAKLSAVRDGADEGHVSRVGKNCRLLSKGMQLSPRYKDEITNNFIDTIELAAPLHDIGKILISDNIISKSVDLTPKEWRLMSQHPVLGAEILQDIYSSNQENNYIQIAIVIAKHHHENWDGSGFPDGLSGTDIPLSARIVSVIDTYDVLISKRCFKEAYSHEESMKIINNQSGHKFDPNIVDILNRIQHKLIRNGEN